ncbi:GyrI-like domain-containing protein [Bacillus daqingensis]|uniref:GyrI-like domain-containing protein n=1 Tax=Bacillus daqingensis TaxID=872396 RepID=A0ABV9NZB6_9BACI
MDSISRLNQAMTFVEEHLHEELDEERVAMLAGTTVYHFKRMFSFLAGMPFSEYVRRRRLSIAANELYQTDAKVIDIALLSGYQSPDAFTRAFLQMHGVTPSESRKTGRMRAFPKLTFQLQLKGGNEMDYRLTEKEAFYINGLKKRVSIQFEGENEEIAEMHKELTTSMTEELLEHSLAEPEGIIQASANFSEGRMEEAGSLDQYLGTAGNRPLEGYASLEVAAGKWAVFTSVGAFPEHLQQTWGSIYAEWLPSSGYEVREGPEILVVTSDDLQSEQVESHIWIPIR